jgi:hypothetical protein
MELTCVREAIEFNVYLLQLIINVFYLACATRKLQEIIFEMVTCSGCSIGFRLEQLFANN